MAWITPRTWAPGLVTSTMMNEISNNFNELGVWTSFTPTLYRCDTNAVIGSTLATGRYLRFGDVCIAQAQATFSAAAVQAGISLPVVPATLTRGIGVCALFGAATPADQSGQGYMTNDRTKLVIAAYTGGFRDAASGHVITYSVTYKVS